jgi:cation diffusion facilitator CzcD-associated flavoprotein CzcO
MSSMSGLPVAVIGAGPVGLAATAHLLMRDIPVKLYEAGSDRRNACPRLGPRASLFAMALQHRRCREIVSARDRLAETFIGRDADRSRTQRRVPRTAVTHLADHCGARNGSARARSLPTRY